MNARGAAGQSWGEGSQLRHIGNDSFELESSPILPWVTMTLSAGPAGDEPRSSAGKSHVALRWSGRRWTAALCRGVGFGTGEEGLENRAFPGPCPAVARPVHGAFRGGRGRFWLFGGLGVSSRAIRRLRVSDAPAWSLLPERAGQDLALTAQGPRVSRELEGLAAVCETNQTV